ncbi:hypothetical protein QQP08_016349, partial [Theobroma cacao]
KLSSEILLLSWEFSEYKKIYVDNDRRLHRRHIVKCSPMAIEKYVQRLLQADSRLLGLSIEGSTATGFNQNENQNLEERVCYNVDASPSHTTTNSLQQQIQSSGLTSPSEVNGSENKSFDPADIYKVDFDYDLVYDRLRKKNNCF